MSSDLTVTEMPGLAEREESAKRRQRLSAGLGRVAELGGRTADAGHRP
jgi:hypothetical protein